MLTAAVPKERRREGHTRLPVPPSSYTSSTKLFTTPAKQACTSTPTTTPPSKPLAFPLLLLDCEGPHLETQREEQDTFDKTLEDIQPAGTDDTPEGEKEQPSGMIVHSLEGFGMEEEKKYEERSRDVLSEMEDVEVQGVDAATNGDVDALDLFENFFSPSRSKRLPKVEFVYDACKRKNLEDRIESGLIGDEKRPDRLNRTENEKLQRLENRWTKDEKPQDLIETGRTEDEKPQRLRLESGRSKDVQELEKGRSKQQRESRHMENGKLPSAFLEAPLCTQRKTTFLPQPILEDCVPAFISPSKQLIDCLPPKTDISRSKQMTTRHRHAPKIVELRSLFENKNSVPTMLAKHNKNGNTHQVELRESKLQQPTKVHRRTVPTLDELRSITKGIELLAQEGCDPDTRANILKGVMLMFHDGPRPRPWEDIKSDPIHMLRQIAPEKSIETSYLEQKSDIEAHLYGNNDDDDDQVMLEAVHVEEQSIAKNHADVVFTERRTQQQGRHRDAAEQSWNEADGAMLQEIMSSDGSVVEEFDCSIDRAVVNLVAFSMDAMGKILKGVGGRMNTQHNGDRVSVKTEGPSEQHAVDHLDVEISMGIENNPNLEITAGIANDSNAEVPVGIGNDLNVEISVSVLNDSHVGENDVNPIRTDSDDPNVGEIGVNPMRADANEPNGQNGVNPTRADLDPLLQCINVTHPAISDSDSKSIPDNASHSELGRIPSTCHPSTKIDKDNLDLQVNGSTSLLQRSYLVPTLMLLFGFLASTLPSAVCSTYTILDACFSTKMIERRGIMGVPVEVEKFSRWGSRPAMCQGIQGSSAVLANFLMDNFLICEARDGDDGMDPS